MLRSLSLLALALTFVGCQTDSSDSQEARSETSSGGSGSQLIEVDNATQLVDSIIEEGNTATVLNFWATWCGPCRIEFPELIAYDAEMEEEGVEVRFVSVDTPEMMDKVRAFLDEQGLTEPSYVSPNNSLIAGEFNPHFASGLPYTLVMDPEGIVRGAHQGMISREQITDLVAGVRDGSIDITTQL